MKASFTALLHKLRGQLGKSSQTDTSELMLQLSKKRLVINLSLLNYHEALLFICAYPANEQQLRLAEKELSRITSRLRNAPHKTIFSLANTGLPYTQMVSVYSHDCISWLKTHPLCLIELADQSDYSLNEILIHTLPSLERSNTSAGFNNQEILEVLGVKETQRLDFYLDQLSIFNNQPSIKDYLFDKLGIEIRIKPKSKTFSRTYNRIPVSALCYQQDWKKHFDIHDLLNSELPKPKPFTQQEIGEVIMSIKDTMTLNDRETDPVTYLDPNSLRVYELDRGISVALYGMVPARQLPMESYVGFTLFKNGFPAAYGGSWVFGERANFGINIFEAFRGGESGYVMCQLLRVYRMAFRVSYFEIEPYQFGLDNPEGITSGAFWFYYKYGFRPIDKTLDKLASQERKKIKINKSHKTSKSVLIRFTESNMALNLGKTVPLSLPVVTQRITKMIQKQFSGVRSLAIAECTRILRNQITISRSLNSEQLKVFQELALVSSALKITSPESHKLLALMIKTKPIDLYEYQRLLLKFLRNETTNK
ncbi:MAG: hypothetical protein WAU36_06030 [Cyclobacteriaceae bacterium]